MDTTRHLDADMGWTTNDFGDRYLFSVNRHSFDKLGAQATLVSHFRERLRKEDTLYLIIGSDSGQLIKYVASLPPARGSRYLFIEPQEIHALLEDEGVLEGLNPMMACTPEGDWMKVAHEFHLNDYLYLDAVEVVFSLAVQEGHAPDYTAMGWSIREDIHQMRWRVAATLGSEAFMICQLQNAADNLLSAHRLKGLFAGKTAVLLAGGPSLDAMLPWVIEHRRRMVVLAVSRIAARLGQVGLAPDFFVSVDPTELSYDISKPMLAFGQECTLLHAYHVNPRLLAQWGGRSLYVGRVLPWKSPLNPDKPLEAPGPTVTNTALHLAFSMGFKDIILAGVDLCFTPEGHTHALGSNERKVGPRFDLTNLTVETNGGTQAPTTPDFAAAIDSLSSQASPYQAKGCRIFTTAAGAARIKGVEYIQLSELRVPDEIIDVTAILDRHLPLIDTSTKKKHVEALLAEFEQKLHQLDDMQKVIEEARALNDRMFTAQGLIENPQDKRKLDRLERRLNTKYRDLSKLVKLNSLRSMLRAMRPFTDYERMGGEETQAIGRDYYLAYAEGAKRLASLIRHAIEIVQIRLLELEPTKDMMKLTTAWKTHAQAGRAHLWQQRHADELSGLDEQARHALDALEDVFVQELATEESGHLRRAREQADLGAARIRARQILNQKNVEALKRLLEGLKQSPEGEKTTAYIALVEGYLQELNDHSGKAMEFYSTVLDSEDLHLQEDALLRIAQWALEHQQAETAEQALALLSSISDEYKLQYADLLALANKPVEALDVYQSYIQSCPEDAHAHMRLIRLLLKIDALDAARLVIEQFKKAFPEIRLPSVWEQV